MTHRFSKTEGSMFRLENKSPVCWKAWSDMFKENYNY